VKYKGASSLVCSISDGSVQVLYEDKNTKILGMLTYMDIARETWDLITLCSKGVLNIREIAEDNSGVSDIYRIFYLSPYAVERISLMEKKVFPDFVADLISFDCSFNGFAFKIYKT